MLAPVLLFIVMVSACIGLRGYHRIDSYQYLVENIFSLDAPDVLVRTLWFIYNLSFSVYHSYTFLSEEKKMRNKVENYSSDFNYDGFRYIHYSFVVCMLILATSFIVALTPNQKICALANLVILVLYFFVGFLYIQYPKAFHLINDMEKQEEKELLQNEQPSVPSTEANLIWQGWRKRVVSNKYYLRSGLTIVQLAHLLGTNRNTLSATINQQEGKNFNTFINELRINEAKEIMLENPTLTLADICTRVGYSDQANFSRHFKEITGNSPVAWKNAQKTV